MALVWINQKDIPAKSKGQFHDSVYASLKHEGKIKGAKQYPNDWFQMQRAYPYESIPQDKYLNALKEARALNAAAAKTKLSNKIWQEAGPKNIPGRITALAIHPSSPNTIYAGSAVGGVFKSIDLGQNWTALFDSVGTQSIGAVAIDPANPNIIYVGTGEANSSGDSYEGTGMYKSIDAGATWVSIGLPNSFHIGRIIIDPIRPDTLYVAVMGRLFGTNSERGVYRSQDGGATWENVLSINDTTGCIDIAISSDYSNYTILASMWTRYRGPTSRISGGMSSGIYRSTDYGDTWEHLTNGLPAAADTVGRIGVWIGQNGNTAYAIYANHPGYFMGVYKSVNLGDSWTRTNDSPLSDMYSNFGWYFGNIRTRPDNPDFVYALGVELYMSSNGGNDWVQMPEITHADHHDMYIHPTLNTFYEGTDGGVWYSTDGGGSWSLFDNMHNTQFYAINIDFLNPQRLYGGTQDNGTLRTWTGALDNWDHILGGDGFYSLIDYTNSNTIYAEYQWGNLRRSFDGGYGWWWAMNGIDYYADRHNWCTPVAMDPQHHNVLYYGSNRIWKTSDSAEIWAVISPDLTNGPGPGNITYGTITTIDVSPTNDQVIYVGTDDANVWVTQNGGSNWTSIKTGLPNRWVTRVAVDPYSPNVAYVTLSGYKLADHMPHIYRTDNYGSDWTAIDGNLPDLPINDVIIDADSVNTLYIGTDFGVYYTTNLGVSWNPLGTGMPLVSVHDLAYHRSTKVLIAGTHGRSIYKIDLPPDFICNCEPGNANGVSPINILDITYLINSLYKSGAAPKPYPLCSGDATRSCNINIQDITFIINYLYKGGPAPVTCDEWVAGCGLPLR
jgi:photosystem II stability/assembly factor-like uncharacterized protein